MISLLTSEGARVWTGRLRRVAGGLAFRITAAVIVLMAVAYTLSGFFLLPRLVKSYAPQYVHDQLKRRLELGDVRVNPLLFKIEIKDFRLQEADGRPLIAFKRLFVDFELSSLIRRAWTFAEITLEEPRLDVVMARDGRLNIAELLDSFPKSESTAPASTTPRRMLLQHARLSGGVVSFTDLSGRAPRTASVEPIDVELHDITTLPGRRGPYAISATLTGGGVVDWVGDVSLVPVGSSGRLGLRGFPLATAWRFAQDMVAIAEPAGRVDAEARYRFAYRDGTTSLDVDGVGVTVTGLVVAERGQKSPLLTLDTIRLAGARGDLMRRELTVPEISVSRGRLAAAIDRDGGVNWQNVMVTRPEAPVEAAPPATPRVVTAPSTAPTAAAPPWRLAVEKLRIEQIALAVADRSHAAPIDLEVGDLAVDLSAKLETAAAGLSGGVEGLNVKVAGVAVSDAARSRLLSLDQIRVENGRIDLAEHKVAIARVGVAGGTTTVVRAADGSIPLVTMLGPAPQIKPARRPVPATPRAPAVAQPGAKPWTVALDRFDFGEHRLAVTDRSVTPAAQLDVTGIALSARNVTTAGKKPFPFDAAFTVKQGGRFSAKGQVAPDGTMADATLSVVRLALPLAQPYIASAAAVELRSGDVSTAGQLTYRAGRDRPSVTYTGSVDVDGVRVVETPGADPVIGWKSLHVDTMRFGLAPDRVNIDEIRLIGLDGKLIIFKDRTLSVAKLMKTPAGPAPAVVASVTTPPPGTTPPATSASPAPAPRPTATAPAASPAPAPAFPVVIERVRLDDSALEFGDLSLVLPFTARVHSLSGVIVGLGSDPDSTATVKLDGRVDEFGLMKVDGALNAFRPKFFTDLGVTFRNVPMSSLTPYSATFAGRRIVAGTLDVDLKYKIDRSALLGDNRVVLTKLQLGERVDSAGAMRLPLDLAIAILSDADGRIDIALPVKGNVDSPEFSYGHLIWQALVTVITKIATSPFRALGALFGGDADAERMQVVAFEPGSDVVLPPEREKLSRVAEVLGKKPRLKLTVHGAWDAKADGEALRSRRVRHDVAQRLGVKLKDGEDPGPIAVEQAKTQRALEALLNERAGAKAVDEFQASFEKTAGRKAERVNPVLAVVGRGSADRAFYDALFRKLVDTTPLPDSEMTSLAQRRGEATARALRERAAAVGDRVEVGDARAAERADKTAVPTRLELGVAS